MQFSKMNRENIVRNKTNKKRWMENAVKFNIKDNKGNKCCVILFKF